ASCRDERRAQPPPQPPPRWRGRESQRTPPLPLYPPPLAGEGGPRRKPRTGGGNQRRCWCNASRQPLRHQHPGGAGRVAIETGGEFVALLQIEARRLEAYREQRHTSAAAPPGFVFGHRQRAAAEIVAAQALGQEEAIDEQLAAIAAAEQPAEDRTGLGVGDEDGERL